MVGKNGFIAAENQGFPRNVAMAAFFSRGLLSLPDLEICLFSLVPKPPPPPTGFRLNPPPTNVALSHPLRFEGTTEYDIVVSSHNTVFHNSCSFS